MEERILASSLQSTSSVAAVPHLRWGIVALLFVATLLNYLDREVLSIISPVLRGQFCLSAVDYSHLLTAFLLGYTLFQPIAGRFADFAGARLGLAIAMLWWSGAAMLAASVRSPWQLGLILFLMGAGESANWPASVKTIQEWFVPSERGIATGIFNCGSSAGAVMAPALITVLTVHYSWRIAFLVSGAIGLIWIAPWLSIYQHRAISAERVPHSEGRNSNGWMKTLRSRNTVALMGARFFADPIWMFFVFWLPDYLNRSRHFSLVQIGATAWLPFLTAMLGNLAGGYLSGRLVRTGLAPRSARVRVMSVAAAVMLSGCSISFISSPMAALLVVSVVTFAYSCWAANVLTLPSDLFPKEQVATVVGLSGMAAGVGGILVMLLVGFLVDHFTYMPALFLIACLPLFGLSFVLTTSERGTV